ncbi:MAG TPA: tetratricopeptide repeat-containing protein [Candidatus Angelobacter sp.]|jgi:pimeloyl-ACP methyl ester carboxylesterase|nr:tetratricopeptide repeat-containing protein [Candidatus Angelobacter sp.]
MPNTLQFFVRKTQKTKAILFVHGFSGNAHHTFGMLPAFIAGNPSLKDWDIHCFGYPTSLAPDITGVWSADPDLTTLGGLLYAARGIHYKQYDRLALVAHSMGGLIVQKALLEPDFAKYISHVALFGTPSNGLRKAGLAKLFKRQARDMAYESVFIKSVRADWTGRYGSGTPFLFRAVAGVKDEFVPEQSSLGPFRKEVQARVNGNHLEIVKPETADSDSAVLLADFLGSPDGAPVTAVRHVSAFELTVATLWPNRKTLAEKERVKLALALEMVGRRSDAIEILTEAHEGNTELTGVLAGRLKRQWLADPDGSPQEGQRALDLYTEAYRLATQRGDHAQAFYNGINVAFLNLALSKSLDDTRSTARDCLMHCKEVSDSAPINASPDKWRLATEGEAHLYLDNLEASLSRYAQALNADPDAREIDSMRRQALWAARLLEQPLAEARLDKLFQTLPGDGLDAKWSA